MIDFELSDNEQQILAKVREQSLVARKYARYYDENEHEFPPDKLPEAEDYPNILDINRKKNRCFKTKDYDK